MVFITGATGFLGAYITHYLVEAGIEVRALKRSSSSLDLCHTFKDRVEWIDGDINDLDALEKGMGGVDKVYHIAGLVSFDPKDKKALIKVNHEGSTNVVNAALQCHVKKILYSSSIAAIGRYDNVSLVTEDTEWNSSSKWNSPYGESKRLGEMEVWRGVAEGLEAVSINPSIILGSGFWRGSLGFMKTVDRGMSHYPGGKTGFVDVRDVANIAIQLMESNISNERYIINAKDLFFKDFFERIARYIDVKAPAKLAGSSMTELVWRLEWLRTSISGKRPLITKDTARVSQKTWDFSNDKIKSALNFSFRDMDITIKEMSEDYLESKATKKKWAFRP